jgi:hypothetical protein
MRLLLVGIALCGAVPAVASEFQPQAISFAYSDTHSFSGMPFDYIVAQPAIAVARQADPAPEPAPQPDEAQPRFFSKAELCTTAVVAAADNDLPPRFFANLIQQESGFKPHVVSPAGAQGIAQFMPRVAAEQGLENPFDPIQALKASAKFVADLLDRFGNVGLAAAAYNAGSKRVSDWLKRRGKLPAETRQYVRNITGRPAERWRGGAKVEAANLPPHARCPGMEPVVADAEKKEPEGKPRSSRTNLVSVEKRPTHESGRSAKLSHSKGRKALAGKVHKAGSSRAAARSAGKGSPKPAASQGRSRVRLASVP